MAIKILSSEITLGYADTVAGARVVRLVNTDGSAVLVTVKSGSTTLGTTTLLVNEVFYLHKSATDTVQSSSPIKATKVSAPA